MFKLLAALSLLDKLTVLLDWFQHHWNWLTELWQWLHIWL